jgi:peptidoglycan/LPS O-acetylase OafA/YrhL
MNPPVRSRIAALDGLRGIAILLVVGCHYYGSVPMSEGSAMNDFLRGAAAFGYTGVDLFFVLSGFLIGGALLNHRASPRLLPAFYARRLFRIIPLYLLLLASFLVGRKIPGLGTVNHGAYFISTVPTWSYFVFLQNVAMTWTRDIGPYWLGVTWSLAVEEQFYLVMPFVIRRISLRQVIGTCVAVIMLSPLLRLNALYHASNAYAAMFLLLTRADGLMWGVLCACLIRENRAASAIRRHGAWLATLVAGGGIAFVYVSFLHPGADSPLMLGWGYSLLSAWFAVALLGVIVFPHRLPVRLLGWRPLAAVGITSYFTYLFHTPIWYLLHWLCFRLPPLHLSWQAGAVTFLALFATLAAAWASWRWFEGPLLKLGQRVSYE